MDDRVVEEIEEIHRLIQDWMVGWAGDKNEFLQRMDLSFDPEFTFVSGSGQEVGWQDFRSHICALESQSAATRIWADNIRVVAASSTLIVARFDEHERDEENSRSRVSTLVFRCNPNCPNGLAWLRLHETRTV